MIRYMMSTLQVYLLAHMQLPFYLVVCYSYTMPTRVIWDLLPEPKGGGNKSHAARGGMVSCN